MFISHPRAKAHGRPLAVLEEELRELLEAHGVEPAGAGDPGLDRAPNLGFAREVLGSR